MWWLVIGIIIITGYYFSCGIHRKCTVKHMDACALPLTVCFTCTERHWCAHTPHMCTLHADLLSPYQLTHTIHTKCPLPLYMNNINVFSSSPPSWKIRSVREPLTLARGCTSMWQWNSERSNIESVYVWECSCKCATHKVLLFIDVYVQACNCVCACVSSTLRSQCSCFGGVGSRSIKVL